MWLSVCVSGEEDVAGVCALPGRAGDAHSSMHAHMLAAAACARAAAQQGMTGKRTETWDATITLRSWPGRDGHGTS
jgi:hypothetical protein